MGFHFSSSYIMVENIYAGEKIAPHEMFIQIKLS